MIMMSFWTKRANIYLPYLLQKTYFLCSDYFSSFANSCRPLLACVLIHLNNVDITFHHKRRQHACCPALEQDIPLQEPGGKEVAIRLLLVTPRPRHRLLNCCELLVPLEI